MDVLRENIGLLQLPYEDEDLNEGFLGFGKKKSRWQRFKDMVKRNKGKIGAGLLGAGALGGDYLLFRNHRNKAIDASKKVPGFVTYDDKTNQIVANDGSVSMNYRPFGLGDEIIVRDKNNNIIAKDSVSRKDMIKNLFS